ncbi:hypothetical protein B0J17DRAFT_734066 [Rhizoctonia solani]|nr:hypothetical protein B0J17DRAFT_734066 [Rhizoctonia solani]
MPGRDDVILARIEEKRLVGHFSSDQLSLADCIPLLEIVLSVYSSSSSLDSEQCDAYIVDHFDLIRPLRDAYASNSFSNLINHPSIRSLIDETQDMDMEPAPLESRNIKGSLQAAFTVAYQGDGHRVFIEVLNSYSLSDHLAYPPSDGELRQYLEDHEGKSDKLLQAEYAILLKHMFNEAKSRVPAVVGDRKGSDLARAWTDYLGIGQSDTSIGKNRINFYKSAVAATRKEIIGISEQVRANTRYHAVQPTTDYPRQMPESSGQVQFYSELKAPVSLRKLFRNMRQSAAEMLEVVAPGHSSRKNACFVYFDEAHNLTKPPRVIEGVRYRSPYHNLGAVLAELSKLPIFFIFLSANTHLQQLAPPASHHPSARAFQGSYLIPPFTELPFDVFTTEMFAKMKESKQLRSLANACTTQVMSNMGRPLWFAHHTQWLNSPQSDQKLDHVIEFAMQKLTANIAPEHVSQSEVAALSMRIGITFESKTHACREMESRLVEAHMRVMYAIPEHWEYILSGSSSEPVLAEAAARYLNKVSKDGIAISGPRILSDNCRNGFVAWGEQGGLCGRLLMTIAHDIAVTATPDQISESLKDPDVIFHRPVPVLAFLRALFADRHHGTILEATPLTDKTGEKLQDAFKEAFVSFSHFVRAGDYAMLEAESLRTALFRGMAIQATDNKESMNAVIPIHMGHITSSIITKTTSAINLQFKNRKRALPCSVDRSITVPDFEQPVISIVFELGEELPKLKKAELSQLVQSHNVDPLETGNEDSDSESAPHPDDHHYSFVARGCGPKTYKVIPEEATTYYDIILASGGLKDDFPRAKHKASWSAVQSLSSSTVPGTKGNSKETVPLDNGSGHQTNAGGAKSGQTSSVRKAKKRKA